MQVRRSLRPLGAAVALASILGLAAFSLHMRLVKSFPAKDQVVHHAPASIELWFSQVPELALTRVRLVGQGDTAFEVGKATKTDDDKQVRLAIVDSLPEGGYTVRWQTAAPDGHKVRGEYGFTYSASTADDHGESDDR